MIEKTLIIIRHGNTFLPEQTPTRVGRNTDLELVEEDRGRAVGKYLLSKGYTIDKAYAAPLKRTMHTVSLALREMNPQLPIISILEFSEIDYGPDENKTEEEVINRLGMDYIQEKGITNYREEEITTFGKQIITEWDQKGIVPKGWSVDVNSIVETWHNFANSIRDGETVMLCSSNGIIRFAPHILGIPYDQFCSEHDIKVATGSVSIFNYKSGVWNCEEWNTKPYKLYR